MKSLLCFGLLSLCAFAASAALAVDTTPTTAVAAPAAVKPVLPGDYAGSWTSSAGAGGKLRLKLKQEGPAWTAEAAFTFDEAEIATKMKSVKVDGAKVELLFDWDIQGTPGQSKITGEAKGNQLDGTYESKTAQDTTQGTWTLTLTRA